MSENKTAELKSGCKNLYNALLSVKEIGGMNGLEKKIKSCIRAVEAEIEKEENLFKGQGSDPKISPSANSQNGGIAGEGSTSSGNAGNATGNNPGKAPQGSGNTAAAA